MGSIPSQPPRRRKRLTQDDILVMLAAGMDPTEAELDEAGVSRFRTVPPPPASREDWHSAYPPVFLLRGGSMSEAVIIRSSIEIPVVEWLPGRLSDMACRRYDRLVRVPCLRYGPFAVARSPIGTDPDGGIVFEGWSVVHAPTGLRLVGGLTTVRSASLVIRDLAAGGLDWSSADPSVYRGDVRYREVVDDMWALWF
jgi:hypothetical protein